MAKKAKNFVESKETALLLARSVAKTEEQTQAKKKQLHGRIEDLKDKTAASNSDKGRLEKAKEVVLASRKQAKLRKAKARRGAKEHPKADETTAQLPRCRKRGVTFA